MIEEPKNDRVIGVELEHEMRQAYLDYSMSVIVARALPDVRDGLKPVQRRILYTMLEEGLRNDRPFRKSANVVGVVMAKYHPHGDVPIYDALVRLAQDLSGHDELLADRHRSLERDVELRGHAPDALVEDRPAHRLVQQRRDDATVEQTVVALMALEGGVARLGTVPGNLEIEIQPAGVQLPAGKAPVLKIDAELRKTCH